MQIIPTFLPLEYFLKDSEFCSTGGQYNRGNLALEVALLLLTHLHY